jgi:hypothetical protein
VSQSPNENHPMGQTRTDFEIGGITPNHPARPTTGMYTLLAERLPTRQHNHDSAKTLNVNWQRVKDIEATVALLDTLYYTAIISARILLSLHNFTWTGRQSQSQMHAKCPTRWGWWRRCVRHSRCHWRWWRRRWSTLKASTLIFGRVPDYVWQREADAMIFISQDIRTVI